jgi:hypothetical protein
MQPYSPTVNEFLLAKFEALLDECDLVADNAQHGQVLDDMDEFFLIKGRKLLQETFEAKLKECIDRTGRLNYCERLAAGRVIGSGLIEGACKNLVGKRLKQTGACWRLERANRIAVLCAALYSDQWKLCWKSTH